MVRWATLAGLGLALLVAAGAVGSAGDPAAGASLDVVHDRVVAARRAGQGVQALADLATVARSQPSLYRSRGYAYLAGVIATEAGDATAAADHFRHCLEQGCPLADRAALALARLRLGPAPDQAAKLLAGFADRHRLSAVAEAARRLEVSALARSGSWARAEAAARALPRRSRRAAGHAILQAAIDRGESTLARRWARRLLEEKDGDEAALTAAELLRAAPSGSLPADLRLLVGRALASHRRFGPALVELGRAAAGADGPELRARATFELAQAAARAGDQALAADGYQRLLARGGEWGERAAYQLGRMALGCGDEEEAVARFQAVAAEAGRTSPVGASALLKLVRLHSGWHDLGAAREAAAELERRLGPASREVAQARRAIAGAALAVGDAGAALADLAASTPRQAVERRTNRYWRGVALLALGRSADGRAELEGLSGRDDLLGRLGRGRLGRLHEVRVEAAARVEAARAALAGGDAGTAAAEARAAVDLGIDGAGEEEAVALLEQAYRRLDGYRQAFELELDEPDRRPEAAAASRRGYATLRYLGLDAEAADELRHRTGRRATAGELYAVSELARRGAEPRLAVEQAGRLLGRLPRDFHPRALPAPVKALLFPDAFEPLVEVAAQARGVDPDLVRAVMKVESRFDPAALSPAGARGLMQFIPETARRVGGWIGLDRLDPRAVHEPAVAIPLGVAYLERLLGIFAGNEGAAVAAYNAGEDAAWEWLERAPGGELDGFWREIEYGETRSYVDRVLTTLASYRARRTGDGGR